MQLSRLLAAGALVLSTGACAVSPTTFYKDPTKPNDTELCRAFYESQDWQFRQDVTAELIRRGMTDQSCQEKIASQNLVLATVAVVATGVAVGVACSNGCSSPGPAYPSLAQGSDIDCAGGGGNGPRYVQGPFYINPYHDFYDLDRDGDGIACEAGEGGWGT